MKERRVWRAGLAWLTGLGVTLTAGLSWGAAPAPVPSPLSREQVNPGGQVEGLRRQRPADVFSGPAREVCQLSDDPALGFTFSAGVLSDPAKVLSAQDGQAAWGEWLGKRITPHQLCEIRDRLALRIFRRGVLARVVIPPQTIASGTVKFEIIAAKIVSVRFDGDDIGPAQAKAEAYLNHLRRRNAFDLDSAQRWLLLVNDIPGVQAAAKIVHSTAPGAPPEGLDLVVTMRRTAVNELAEVSNVNSKSLGPWSGIARADFNSFTGLGERSSVVVSSTIGENSQQVVQLIEAVKLGDSGLFGQASFSYGHSRPGDVLKPLDLTGNSYSGSCEADYPLIRLQRETVMVAAGMDLVDQETTFPTGQAVSADSLRVAWVRADASVAAIDRPVGSNLVTTQADLTVQVRKGLDVLGASRAGEPALSRLGGRPDGWVVRGDGHASIRIAPMDSHLAAITLSTHVLGQWADRPLLAFEQQGIGNLTIGRGYDPNATSGDRVIAGEFKIQVGPLRLWRNLKVTPYAFEDVARVGYLTAGEKDVTLRSVGGGLEFRVPYDRRGDAIRIDAGYAKPLDKPVPSAIAKPPEEFLLQIIIVH